MTLEEEFLKVDWWRRGWGGGEMGGRMAWVREKFLRVVVIRGVRRRELERGRWGAGW